MLTQEENELLVRTGPGTPMGNLFRRFWLPVMLSEEIPEPGCTPARLRVLNEDLIAFRDTDGNVGIIDAHCAHRFSPLFFGMNEESGLRCLYHGWKYDFTGQCVDIPFIPEGESFKDKIKLKSYPALDKGGFIWAYMGPAELQPPFPNFDFAAIPESHRENWKIICECNWMQSMEGQNDPSHAYFTHGFREITEGGPGVQMGLNNAAVFRQLRLPGAVVDTEFGISWATVWNSDDEEAQVVNIGHFVLPVFDPSPSYNNPGRGRLPLGYQRMRVPIDDVTCMVLRVRWNPEEPLAEEFREAHNAWLVPEKLPGTYRPVANKANDYLGRPGDAADLQLLGAQQLPAAGHLPDRGPGRADHGPDAGAADQPGHPEHPHSAPADQRRKGPDGGEGAGGPPSAGTLQCERRQRQGVQGQANDGGPAGGAEGPDPCIVKPGTAHVGEIRERQLAGPPEVEAGAPGRPDSSYVTIGLTKLTLATSNDIPSAR